MITESSQPRPLTGRAVLRRKSRVSDCHSLDLAQLRREGLFQRPRAVWTSTRSWGPIVHSQMAYALVANQRGPNGLVLMLDHGNETTTQTVSLTLTRPYFGGHRWWFLCRCGRRCRVLYWPPGTDRFGCRLCWDLTYESRQEHRLFAHELMRIGDRLERLDRDLRSRSPRRRARAARRMGAADHAAQRVLAAAKRWDCG